MVGVNFDWSVVRKWRIDNSVRVEDLAKEIGTSRPQLTVKETLRTPWTVHDIYMLATKFNFDPMDLLEECEYIRNKRASAHDTIKGGSR